MSGVTGVAGQVVLFGVVDMGLWLFGLVVAVVLGVIWAIASFVRQATENPVEDSARILKRFKGSVLLGASAIEELIITDRYAMSRAYEGSGYVKRTILFTDIAQVNVRKGLMACELEIVNRGSGPNLRSKGLSWEDAKAAQGFLEEKRRGSGQGHAPGKDTRIEGLERLGRLRQDGLLTQEEFEREKSKLLGE